jgi:hypothetical protein
MLNAGFRSCSGRIVVEVGAWDVVVPVASVVLTGGVAIWSKIIDARSKREDRTHTRALDYEGRVWQAKNDALRGLISACRYVKRRAQVEGTRGSREGAEQHRHLMLFRALSEFAERIGDDEGISEITAYAAEPVREALDQLLELINKRIRPCRVQLVSWKESESRLEHHLEAARKEQQPGDDRIHECERTQILEKRIVWAQQRIATAELDIDAVVRLCDKTIEVARLDLHGHYAQWSSTRFRTRVMSKPPTRRPAQSDAYVTLAFWNRHPECRNLSAKLDAIGRKCRSGHRDMTPSSATRNVVGCNSPWHCVFRNGRRWRIRHLGLQKIPPMNMPAALAVRL